MEESVTDLIKQDARDCKRCRSLATLCVLLGCLYIALLLCVGLL